MTDLKDPSCPKCGAPMVKKQATRGVNKGGNFWGCTKYPGCHGIIGIIPSPDTVTFEQKVVRTCPQCGTPMIHKGQSFWGCPNCKGLTPILTPEDLAIRAQTQALLHIFDERDQKLLTLRYGIGCDPHTLASIGKILDLSRERVRQLEKRVLRQLKHPKNLKKMPGGTNG